MKLKKSINPKKTPISIANRIPEVIAAVTGKNSLLIFIEERIR